MPGPAYAGLTSVIDLFNAVVLAMIGYALFRRIVIRPRLIPMNLDAGVILDGRIPHVLLLEIFTDHGIGTLIRRAE